MNNEEHCPLTSVFIHTYALNTVSVLVPLVNRSKNNLKSWWESTTIFETGFIVLTQLRRTCPPLRPDKLICPDPLWPSALILEIWWSCFQSLGTAQWPRKLKSREDISRNSTKFYSTSQVLHMWPACKVSDYVFGEYLKIPNIMKPPELL